MRVAALVLALCLCGAPAQAQSGNPVVTHYRAYQAALANGDVAGAEAAAVEALAASQLRDGEGGSTGALALNLARVRVVAGDAAGAYEPAQLALRALEAVADQDDPNVVMARLTLGQSVLARGDGDAVLAAALASVGTPDPAHPEVSEVMVDAGGALAMWAFEREDFQTARSAYAKVATHAVNGIPDSVVLLARARVGEAASILIGMGRRRQPQQALEARALLREAAQLLRPFAEDDASEEPTPAQVEYATALAWRTLTDRFIAEREGDQAGRDSARPLELAVGACPLDFNLASDLSDFYPRRASYADLDGVVVVRAVLDADGSFSRIQVVAAAPQRLFPEAATRIARNTHVARKADAPVDCRMPSVVFISYSFMVR